MADTLDLRLTNASELLRRYHKDGLIVRQKVQGLGAPRVFMYLIPQKGAERLTWLDNNLWEVSYE